MSVAERVPTSIEVEPLTPRIGAEIRGVRMGGNVPDAQIAEIRQALLDWKVIFFRDQDVSEAEHVAFGRRFGPLEIHPFAKSHPDHPEILVIHHDERSKQGQNRWHTDVTFRQEPPLGSILRARIVPPVGGDTLFADMGAAYERLDDETRALVDGAYAIHSFAHNFGKRMDEGERERFLAQYPPARHPLVRTHPETGGRSLFFSAPFTTHVEGLEPDESRKLLRRLYLQAMIPEVQCRFRWRVNSVAFWDNRAVQHYAAFDYHPHVRRVERVTIEGDRPF